MAWVDDGGKLHVGPRSAGALPGPAAYGKGGTEPTTTDANLCARSHQSGIFLRRRDSRPTGGGQDASARRRRLGVDVDEAARGIVRIANNNMMNALKLVSTEPRPRSARLRPRRLRRWRRDARVALALELGDPESRDPGRAAVFSAWGMLMTDLRRDYVVTHLS